MINGKYHKEADTPKGRIIIDLCEWGDRFEVMAMYENGDEINCKRKDTLPAAVRIWRDMCKAYLPKIKKELSGKYAKLRDDIRAAVEAGRAAVEADPDDGGTCNLDGATLFLPRWNEEKVKQAAEEAGAGAWKWNFYGTSEYVLSTGYGQGNARTRYAEAMHDSLKAAGYDAGMYYAMD